MEEGERAWPSMQPGRIKRPDGSFAEGVSPSGAKRGDRFVLVNDEWLKGGDEAYGAVRTLSAKIAALVKGLEPALQAEPRLDMRIIGRTDALFACFPGEGAKYNCHFDGGGGDPRAAARD